MAGGEGMGWKGTLGIALFVPAVVWLVAPVALRAQHHARGGRSGTADPFPPATQPVRLSCSRSR